MGEVGQSKSVKVRTGGVGNGAWVRMQFDYLSSVFFGF